MAKLPYETNGRKSLTWTVSVVGIIVLIVGGLNAGFYRLYAADVRGQSVRLRAGEQSIAVINSRLDGIQQSLDRIESRLDRKLPD